MAETGRLEEVAVIVTRRGGREVLLVHRAADHGAYWHVVAGGVERGEAPAEAAARELREETGLVVAPLKPGLEVVEHVDTLTEQPADANHAGAQGRPVVAVRVTCFRVGVSDDWEPTLDWEHDGHRWCDPAEAERALRWPGTAHALRLLTASARPRCGG